ncbi:TolC family protein [Hymenobacter sp. UV11]|uniref:TolC family protein n=1 Tax=Hymenobacter sp. UV11 TaxID=1849735 RepID=UPI00105E6053|nr:TolC family protein [Hymenobacter sp. UV11]TFZ65059.1 TolC family protein [Hymenobacter sp. UV11]
MRNLFFLPGRSCCRAAAAGLGLLAVTLSAAAQSNPAAPPATRPAPAGSGQPGGIGGPPVGQQQQQELQQRQQEIQQTAQQQRPPTGPTSPPPTGVGQTPPASQGAPSPGGLGTLGEPSGTTTPPAQVGSAPRGGTMMGTATGAARTLAVAPATLSLPEAMTIGLENNLTTLLATERATEARALRQQVRSFLLPNITGTAYQQNRTLNLVAQGLVPGGSQDMMGGGTGGGMAAAPTIPSFVGPFNTFDARLNFSQALLNIAALRQYKSSAAAVQVADLTAELAREQVATFVALAYLSAQRGSLDVRAARADLSLAEALRQLAQKQRDAGIADGIDVVRAEVRESQQRLRLAQAEASATQDRLDLARAVGLPQGSATVLTDTLVARAEAVPTVEEALAPAQAARLDTRIAEQTIAQKELDRRARAAARYPIISAAGDYGQSAVTPFKNDRATRTYGVLLSVPVFDGGYINSRVKAALSEQRQAELELGNTRGQVEQDVRQALIGWNLAAAQVRAADEQLALAGRELALATQRFRAGVADNLEVLQAQAALANARALRVQALAQYGAARLNFAAATGTAQSFRL